MTTRYAIRVLKPKRYAGDIFELNQCDTREQHEAFRLTLGTPANFEVVEIDEDGHVIPPRQHRIVTTIDFGDIHRHRCLDCHASRSGINPPPPPCPGEAA